MKMGAARGGRICRVPSVMVAEHSSTLQICVSGVNPQLCKLKKGMEMVHVKSRQEQSDTPTPPAVTAFKRGPSPVGVAHVCTDVARTALAERVGAGRWALCERAVNGAVAG